MNALMTTGIATLAILLLCAAEVTNVEPDQWLEQRFTRVHRQGNYTTDPACLKRFQPSGVGSDVYQLLDVAVLHSHALFWSNEENADDSKDMLASVIVFRNNKRIFAARGYRFSRFRMDRRHDTVTFDLWTGTMGNNQIRQFTLDVSGNRLKVSETLRSTKDG